jgi:hypothetical protein
MELFTAGDQSQMEVIKQWIDESDVFLLILGGRYGSSDPETGKSYTQLEYEYAVGLPKPLFACVIKESSLEARVKTFGTGVIEMKNQSSLEAFRAEVLMRIVEFWEDSKDIRIAISKKLSEFSRREDLVGWVRPDKVNVGALADEIARLSRENSQLRLDLSQNGAGNSMSMSFDGMRKLLTAKGLVEFLEGRRTQLGHRAMSVANDEDQKKCAELCVMGLISLDEEGFPPRYTFTERGREFLNRLESERLI